MKKSIYIYPRVYASSFYTMTKGRLSQTNVKKRKTSKYKRMNIENWLSRELLYGNAHLSCIFGGVLGAIWHTVFSRQQQQQLFCRFFVLSTVFSKQRVALEVPFFHSVCYHSSFQRVDCAFSFFFVFWKSNETKRCGGDCMLGQWRWTQTSKWGHDSSSLSKTPFLF